MIETGIWNSVRENENCRTAKGIVGQQKELKGKCVLAWREMYS